MSVIRGVFLYAVTITFAAGVLLRSFFICGFPVIAWILCGACVSALLWRRSGAPLLLLCSVVLASGALGMLRMEWASWSEVNPVFEVDVEEHVIYEGLVVREPEQRERSTHLYVLVSGELLLAYADVYSEVSYGDRVKIMGTLGRPESFVTDLGRTFNYPGYLRARGVGYVLSFADVQVIGQEGGNNVMFWLLTWKHAFMRTLERSLLPLQAGLGEGLLLGVKRALGDDLETAFRQTGIIHIVVLSGFNIMLVVAFVLYGLSFVVGLRGRILCGLIAIIAFAATVGFSATVLRASLMAALCLVLKLTRYAYAVTRGLFFTAFLMILFNPYLLAFDVGFQLSFLATYGLIVLAPEIERIVPWIPNIFGLRGFFTATVATQIIVLPLLLYQIGEFSVIAIVVNMLVLPMVPIAMLLTFSAGMVALCSATLASPFILLAHISLTYIIEIAKWFSALPFSSFVVPAFSWWGVVLGYAGIGVAFIYVQRRQRISGNLLYGWTIEEVLDDDMSKDDFKISLKSSAS